MTDHNYFVMVNHPIQLPYCVAKLPVAGHVWLPLNRKYKPLGIPWDEHAWVDYLDFAEQAIEFSSDPRRWKHGWEDYRFNDMLYLQNDGTSAAQYFERLAKLMATGWTRAHKQSIELARERLTAKHIRATDRAAGWSAVAEHCRVVGLEARQHWGAGELAIQAVHKKLDSKLRRLMPVERSVVAT